MAGTNGRCDPYLPSKDALWSMRALRPLCSARTDHPRRGHHAIADGPRPAPALTRTSTTKRGASPQNDAACPQVNTPGVPGRTQEETRASQSGTNPVKKGKTVKKVKKKIKIKSLVTKVEKSRKSAKPEAAKEQPAKPAAAKKPAKPSEAVFVFAKPWEAVSKDGRMFWWNTVTGEWGHRMLQAAVKADNFAEVQRLLATPGFDVDTCEWALQWAVVSASADVVRLLLATPGINVNCVLQGVTPLIAAILKNRGAAVIEVLLATSGIDVNAIDERGNSALMNAILNGEEWRTDVVELLLAADSIDVNAKGEDGASALMFATANGRTDFMKLLLEADGSAR